MDREELLSKMSDDTKQYADRVMAMYNAPFIRYIGLEIERIEKDRVECSLELIPELLNSMDRGHGGVLYSLMDHTFAIASNMEHDGTGQSSEIKFYRPAKGKLRCVAVPINKSRSLEVYDSRIYNEEGKLVASSTCTAFLLNKG